MNLRAEAVPPPVHGFVDSGFEPLRNAFERNLRDFDGAGAGACVYLHGKQVADLWGGTNPISKEAYTSESVTTLFSATKAATALCAHLLAERGLLDYDAPVAKYWPEFAQAGKSALPVRWLLCHKSGLPSPDPRFDLRIRDYLDWDRMVAALARQRPWWEPGTRVYYHAITFGFLVGEVIRRIAGKTVGQFFAEEVARPLNLQFWIGLPPDRDHLYSPGVLPSSVSDAYWAGLPESDSKRESALSDAGTPSRDPGEVLRKLGLDPASTAAQIPWIRAQLLMPEGGGARGSEFFNTRSFRAAEVPASSGVANANALARMYASCIGEIDGVRLLRPGTVDALRRCETDGVPAPAPDVVLSRGVPPRLGLGYQLPTETNPMLGPGSFGHSGAGGRLGFAHPELGLAFGYVSTQLWSDHTGSDPRWIRLLAALRDAMSGI